MCLMIHIFMNVVPYYYRDPCVKFPHCKLPYMLPLGHKGHAEGTIQEVIILTKHSRYQDSVL